MTDRGGSAAGVTASAHNRESTQEFGRARGSVPGPNEHVPCNCCGSTDLQPVYSMPDPLFPSGERFTVVECRRCGLGFVNPRPRRADMARFYPPEYYTSFRPSPRHEARYARQAQYLSPLESSGRAPRLLDVGCAHGDFPRFMQRRGWEVEGIEVSEATAAVHDFPIYREDFPHAPLRAGSYDAVTAWAVFEHLHDPAASFRQAARVLKPGGLFVFLVTNFESLASKRLYAEDVPRHLYFFTEGSVRRYLRDVGLQLTRADYSQDIYELPATNWLPYAASRLSGRPFRWDDRVSLVQFRRERGLEPGLASTLRFCLHSPLSALDRMFVPIIDQYHQWRRTYGIVTFVASKPPES